MGGKIWKKDFISRAANYVIIVIRRWVISIILIFHGAVNKCIAAASKVLHLVSSPKRALALVILAAAVLGPGLLFLSEHANRLERESELKYVRTAVSAENYALKSAVGELLAERSQLHGLLLDAGYKVYSDGELRIKVTTTGYSSSPIETDDTPFITAANTATRNGIIALSRDLLQTYTPDAPFRFGDCVMIQGLGEFVVEDSMHGRWRKRADIWFPSRTQALQFGKKELTLSKPIAEAPLLGMIQTD